MMVYELYFEEHMKKLDIDILQFVDTATIIKPIIELKNKKAKAKIIGDVFDWLQKKENPIRNRIILSNIRSPDIIKVINSTL
jgi:hypothetical protein